MRWTLFKKFNLNFSPKLIRNPIMFENALIFSDLVRHRTPSSYAKRSCFVYYFVK